MKQGTINQLLNSDMWTVLSRFKIELAFQIRNVDRSQIVFHPFTHIRSLSLQITTIINIHIYQTDTISMVQYDRWGHSDGVKQGTIKKLPNWDFVSSIITCRSTCGCDGTCSGSDPVFDIYKCVSAWILPCFSMQMSNQTLSTTHITYI